MTENEFEVATPRFFITKLKAVNKIEVEKAQGEWERTRWLAAVLLNPHSKRHIKPTDVCRFPWEQSQTTAEEIEALKEHFERLTLDGEWKPMSYGEVKAAIA